MRTLYLIPVATTVVGISFIASAVASGDAEVSLFLIFPVVSGSGLVFLAGILLVAFSFVLWFLVPALGWREAEAWRAPPPIESTERPHSESSSKYGGVILIGPIPIAFGSNKRIATMMLVLGIVLALVFLALLIGLAH